MKKLHLKVVEETQDIDLHELIKALQVPEIQKIMYHQFEEIKAKYMDEITQLDQVTECQEEYGENIILLNRDQYFPLTTPEKLRRFFKTVLAIPKLQKIVLDDFESVYIPMMEELRDLRIS